MCFVQISTQTITFAYTTLSDWFCITVMESVYCAIVFNFLNAELNRISPMLALLGAHHILHVSRIRVKGLV